VLDVALAFAVINRHFNVADFLLERGADINTNWNSHEPASILHTLGGSSGFEQHAVASVQVCHSASVERDVTGSCGGWNRKKTGRERRNNLKPAAPARGIMVEFDPNHFAIDT